MSYLYNNISSTYTSTYKINNNNTDTNNSSNNSNNNNSMYGMYINISILIHQHSSIYKITKGNLLPQLYMASIHMLIHFINNSNNTNNK